MTDALVVLTVASLPLVGVAAYWMGESAGREKERRDQERYRRARKDY